MTTEITASNVGPVSAATIPLDPEGGVTVLYGFNGAGKDTVLDAVSRLTGGKQAVSCKDGEKRGSVDGLGVHLTVAKSTRRSGECDAVSLAGKFDLSDFVEPPFKDGDASDRHRIKALLAIRGVEGAPDAFASIHPDLDLIASADALAETDIVEQARLIKGSLEQCARKIESDRDKERGIAQGARAAAGDVEEGAEYDEEGKTAELMQAVSEQSRLTEQAKSYATAQENAEQAKRTLAEIQAGPSVEECLAHVKECEEDFEAKKDALRLAQVVSDSACSALEAANWGLTVAKREKASTAAAHAAIKQAANVKPVNTLDIDHAATVVKELRTQVQQGAVIREAIRQHAEAKKHEAEAERLDTQAQSVRGAARQTDDVLSGLVSSGRIRVEQGRLVVDHPRRGVTAFSELSKGEKWRIALLEAGDRIREIGAEGVAVVPIPQQAWEGLQPAVRAEIWKQARELKVNILAAQCDDGPLRAEMYAPTGDEVAAPVADVVTGPVVEADEGDDAKKWE